MLPVIKPKTRTGTTAGARPPAQQQSSKFEALHPRGRGGEWIVKPGAGTNQGEQPNQTTAQLQQRLQQLGFRVPINGRNDAATMDAVRTFQQRYGLTTSGGVDAATLTLLQNPPPQTLAQVQKEKGLTSTGQKISTAAASTTASTTTKKATTTKKITAAQAATRAATGTTTRTTTTNQLGDAVIGRGATGQKVTNVQDALQKAGYSVTKDGVFDAETEAAIKKLQADHGLKVDGVVGPETRGLLIGLGSSESSKALSAATKAAAKSASAAKTTSSSTSQQKLLPGEVITLASGPAKVPASSGGKMKLQKPKAIKASAHLLRPPGIEETTLRFGYGGDYSHSLIDGRRRLADYDLPIWSRAGHRPLPDPTIPDGRPALLSAAGLPGPIPDGRDWNPPDVTVALMEAVKARKEATNGYEFERARARERVLRKQLAELDFKEWLHPRGRGGKWIGKPGGSLKRVDGGGIEREATTALREPAAHDYPEPGQLSADPSPSEIHSFFRGVSNQGLLNYWGLVDREVGNHQQEDPDLPANKQRIVAQMAAMEEYRARNPAPTLTDNKGEKHPDVKDILVVGAGPGGLTSAIYGACEGHNTMLVDAGDEEHAGGQMGMSSRIANYPGFVAGVPGWQLGQTGVQQARRLGAQLQFNTRATGIENDPETGIKTVHLDDGTDVRALNVIVSGGVEFRAPDWADSPNVSFGNHEHLAAQTGDGDALIVGGGNSAGQAAEHVAASAHHVTILLRGNNKLSKSMSEYLIRAIQADPTKFSVKNGEVDQVNEDADGIQSVTLKDGQQLECNGVGVFIGSVPKTDWLSGVQTDKNGYIVAGGDLENPAGPRENHETSMPGVFVVGDQRANSMHRVANAVGDGAITVGEIEQKEAKKKQRLATPQMRLFEAAHDKDDARLFYESAISGDNWTGGEPNDFNDSTWPPIRPVTAAEKQTLREGRIRRLEELDWNEALHPRGRGGEWVDVLGKLRAPDIGAAGWTEKERAHRQRALANITARARGTPTPHIDANGQPLGIGNRVRHVTDSREGTVTRLAQAPAPMATVAYPDRTQRVDQPHRFIRPPAQPMSGAQIAQSYTSFGGRTPPAPTGRIRPPARPMTGAQVVSSYETFGR